MTRNDFRQKALIHIASALVKVMDEQCEGILDNEAAHTRLAVNTVSIMSELEDAAMPHDPTNDHGIYFDDDEREDKESDGRYYVRLRYEDGQTRYHAVQDPDEPTVRGGTQLMHEAAKVFYELREKHPEVTEIRFYTDDNVDE